jgi:hypothetical protein
MNNDIKRYVKGYLICAKVWQALMNTKNRVIEKSEKGYLWEYDPMGRIMDINGKRLFIFTAVDHYSKWVEAEVIPYKGGERIAEYIERLIIKNMESLK